MIVRHTLQDYIDALQNAGLLADSTVDAALAQRTIDCFSYDNRAVEGTALFFCKGAHFKDTYLRDALSKGAVAYVADHAYEVDAPRLLVSDIRHALVVLGRLYYNDITDKLVTVGITGTKGKSTTAYYMRYILNDWLSAQGKPDCALVSSIDTYDGVICEESHITTPEVLELYQHFQNAYDSGITHLVMEASSQAFKVGRVRGMTFDVGVFTNFSNDHIGGVEHKDMAEYLYCKSLLFRQCRNAAANIDDPAWEKITADFEGNILTYGFSEGAKLRAKNDRLLSDNGFIGVHFETEGLKNLSPDVGVPGKFNAYNALAAISAVSFFDIPDKAILDGLKIAHVKGRVEPVKVPGNYSLLIDYAHNALSMENVLTTLRQYKPNRLITMFGAGGNRPKVRRYEMGETSGRLSDLSVITEDNSRFEDVMDIIADIKTGLHKTDGKYVVVPKRKEAIRYCMLNAQDGDIIVLAGKGHEDYQEIKGVKYHMDERELIAEIIEEEGL